MTIDIKELRMLTQDFKLAGSPMILQTRQMSELLDRLEVAEKERDFAKTEIARLHDDIRELTDVRVLDEEDRDRIVAWLQGTATKPAANFADAYQGAMEEVAIWKKRTLEAEDLNRKFVAEINGPTYMGEPAQPAPSVPDGWKEAAIAWEVCASIHREYGKGKDPFFNTRQGDFVKHANDARAMLAAAPEVK